MKTANQTNLQHVISRVEAARLLRAARQGLQTPDLDDAGEAIGWALSVLRDHPQARRLKIEYLLRLANYDSADALIARSLFQDQDHPLLRWRYARSLHAQGRLEAADGEIREVLVARPRHTGALTLAARIAGDLGDHDRAVELLLKAARERPTEDSIGCQLTQTLLDANRPDEAELILQGLASPPAVLTARVLLAKGRVLEAIECLQASLRNARADQPWQVNACELIDVLERIGDLPRLRSVLAEIATLQSSVANTTISIANSRLRLRIGVALLGMGEFESAAAILLALSQQGTMRSTALQHLVVAYALAGRPTEAAAVLAEWRGMCNRHQSRHARPASLDPVVDLAKLWLHGLLGAAMTGQGDARQAGADPSLTVLQPMLRDAARVFDAALRNDALELKPDERTALERHRATCLAAMAAPAVQVSAHHPPDMTNVADSQAFVRPADARRAA